MYIYVTSLCNIQIYNAPRTPAWARRGPDPDRDSNDNNNDNKKKNDNGNNNNDDKHKNSGLGSSRAGPRSWPCALSRRTPSLPSPKCISS